MENEILESRKFSRAKCCETCKHCYRYFVRDKAASTAICIRMCFLDKELSDEQDEGIWDVLSDSQNPWHVKAPEEYRELLLLPEGEDSIIESIRFVLGRDVCDHYKSENDNAED